MNKLFNPRNCNIAEVRGAVLNNDSSVAVVPYGEIHVAAAFGRNCPQDLDANVPVLAASFPATSREFDEKLPSKTDWGMALLTIDSPPLLAFHLQVGSSLACWFGSIFDDHVWEMLEGWSCAGNMVLAASLDDGKTVFGVNPFTMTKDLRKLQEDALASNRVEGTKSFQAILARLYAESAIKKVAHSGLPQYPTLERAHMCVVRTAQTGAMAIPADHLPAHHPLSPRNPANKAAA